MTCTAATRQVTFLLALILLPACSVVGELEQVDGGPADAGPNRYCHVTELRECAETGLEGDWDALRSEVSRAFCQNNSDCVFLDPGNGGDYNCDTDPGTNIWGKDGFATVERYVDEANRLNEVYLEEGCVTYREICFSRVADGHRRIGAECTNNRCELIEDPSFCSCGADCD